MQKAFVAIALALTLTCAFGYTSFNSTGYAKAPMSVVADSELNYTNGSSLMLASVNMGELDITSLNSTAPTDSNMSNYKWSAVYRKLDGKTLAASTNSTLSFTGGMGGALFLNGYAISLSVDNDTNMTPQVSVYQAPVNGGAALGRILISSNMNVNFTPMAIGAGIIGKNVYIFYLASTDLTKVNVTSFVAGGAKGSLEFTLTTTFNFTAGNLNVVWGEALGSNQLYANWMDGVAPVLKYSTIDVSKGTVSAVALGGWNSSYKCVAYATDKKWFGDLCSLNTMNNGTSTLSLWARTNSTNLVALTNNTLNGSVYSFSAVFPYSQYIAILYVDSTIGGNRTYSYDLWNLDTLVQQRARALILTTDSGLQFFRVTSGGLFTLTYNTNQMINNQTLHYSGIQVGLALGSSYLTSVLGFIMAVVAGLLAF